MKFQPLNDYVLIERVEVDQEGGIIRPDNAVEVSSKGIVRALPPFEKPQFALTVGDTVMFSRHGATEVEGMKGHVLVSWPELFGRWTDGAQKASKVVQ